MNFLLSTSAFLCGCLLSLCQVGAIAQVATQSIVIHFDTDKSEMGDEAPLMKHLEALVQSPGMKIIGHADYTGGEGYNMKLSEKRANTVAKWLENHGVDAGKISIEAKGETDSRPDEKGDQLAEDRKVVVVFQINPTPKLKPVEAKKPTVAIEAEVETFDIDTSGKENLVLKGVSFIGGRHFPTPESMPELYKLAETMKQHPQIKIEIQGHICCAYDQPDGLDNDTGEPFLSKNRAKYVYKFLIQEGISADRMSYIGLGSTQPKVFPEITEADMQANRRVEIKIIKD